MHANVATDRGGGGGGSWRLPPDETLQVQDSKAKEDVSWFHKLCILHKNVVMIY